MTDKTGIFAIKLRLIILNFLQFAIWGAYLTSLGTFLAGVGLSNHIGEFYAMQGMVSIFMPGLIGIVADRFIQAQKTLSLCQLISGLCMLGAALYCHTAGGTIEFGPLFLLYSLSVAFYMPTIGLSNSVAYSTLERNGLDTVKYFPQIRIFGTIGFICMMLFVNFVGPEGAKYQTTYMQLVASGILGIVMALYALTMPACATNKASGGQNRSLAESLGLNAFKLFKQRRMATFFIFSMLLGVALQITNSYANPYITSFVDIPAFADTWGARNANALISLSQMSETLCILLIPFCLRRFGIKGVMLMSMIAWVLRFALLGAGDPGSGLWLFLASMIVYGIAFDFFNVSGSLFVDNETDSSIRSSAQGVFMMMTNGIGATLGTLIVQGIINNKVFSQPDMMLRLEGWRESWYMFAAYALVIAILFAFIFKGNKKDGANVEKIISEADPEGLVEPIEITENK